MSRAIALLVGPRGYSKAQVDQPVLHMLNCLVIINVTSQPKLAFQEDVEEKKLGRR